MQSEGGRVDDPCRSTSPWPRLGLRDPPQCADSVNAPRQAESSSQVEGEVRQRCVLGWDGAGDDAEHTEVGGKVVVGLLEQLEGEVELGLGDPLTKIEVNPIGHEDAASMRGKAQGLWGGDTE